MKTTEEILVNLTQCKEKLQKRFHIFKLALFGSYARGEQTENSDVDVLVAVDPAIGLEFVTLAQMIEKELGVSTDVVSERALKPRYRQAIEAELIYV